VRACVCVCARVCVCVSVCGHHMSGDKESRGDRLTQTGLLEAEDAHSSSLGGLQFHY
jgi:hypothetical protein